MTGLEDKLISVQIHPTAIVGPKAVLGNDVSIGPYSIIEDGVKIGDGSSVGNHTTIKKGTTVGEQCKILHSCSIGEDPQDLKFGGEETETFIGDQTTIREFVTINRGTAHSGATKVGSRVVLMAYVHLAHDCFVGNDVIFANLVTLGGHVHVGDWASLGGGVLVHQFCRVGDHAFVGGGYRIVQDVPPFILAAGEPLSYSGVNRIGLRRRGFDQDQRNLIKKVYQLFFRSGLSRTKALEQIKETLPESSDVEMILDFIQSSERGII